MWSPFDPACIPSHHSLRATCVQLLPLVEMYCKWELQEDCTNLWELMLRFDSEAELQSHELGRSMLLMVRDDDVGLHQLLPRTQSTATVNPFDAIRTMLAAVGTAFEAMHPQVHLGLDVPSSCSSPQMLLVPLGNAICLFPLWATPHHIEYQNKFASNSCRFDFFAFSAPSPCRHLHSVFVCSFFFLEAVLLLSSPCELSCLPSSLLRKSSHFCWYRHDAPAFTSRSLHLPLNSVLAVLPVVSFHVQLNFFVAISCCTSHYSHPACLHACSRGGILCVRLQPSSSMLGGLFRGD